MSLTLDPSNPLKAVISLGSDEVLEVDKDGFLKGAQAPVKRNCINAGPQDTSNPPKPTFLQASATRAMDLVLGGLSLVLDFAAGVRNLRATLTANAAGVLTAPIWNTSFIYATYVSPTSVAWGSTLKPVQDGVVFQRNKQALLRFAGANNSTVFLDDYGNTWQAGAGVSINTGTLIDGLNTCVFTGVATSCLYTTDIPNLGNGSWTIKHKMRITTLPAEGVYITLLSAANAAPCGVSVYLRKVSGVNQLISWWSSDGASHDMSAALLGTKTNWAINTTYEFKVTYDALAGKYYVIVDGVVDSTFTSALKVYQALTIFAIGNNSTAGGNFGAFRIAGLQFLPYCEQPNGVTQSVPSYASIAVEGDWIDTSQSIQCKTATGPSTAAGTDPVFTPVNRAYVSEVDTNATTVVPTTGLRNYRYSGKYYVRQPAPAMSTTNNFSHNVGAGRLNLRTRGAFVKGGPLYDWENVFAPSGSQFFGAYFVNVDRCTASIVGANSGVFIYSGPNGGNTAVEAEIVVERDY